MFDPWVKPLMRAIRNQHEARDRAVLIRHPFDQSIDISRAIFCPPTDQNALPGFGWRGAHVFIHNVVHAELASPEDLARFCQSFRFNEYCGLPARGKGAV
jgi:hypothetical protein